MLSEAESRYSGPGAGLTNFLGEHNDKYFVGVEPKYRDWNSPQNALGTAELIPPWVNVAIVDEAASECVSATFVGRGSPYENCFTLSANSRMRALSVLFLN